MEYFFTFFIFWIVLLQNSSGKLIILGINVLKWKHKIHYNSIFCGASGWRKVVFWTSFLTTTQGVLLLSGWFSGIEWIFQDFLNVLITDERFLISPSNLLLMLRITVYTESSVISSFIDVLSNWNQFLEILSMISILIEIQPIIYRSLCYSMNE